MSMHAQALISKLEELAPKRWAEDWDNVGLLVGTLQKYVERVLVALDVTPAVVEEACELGCQLIITHHPVIFKPLKALRTDLEQGRLLEQLIKHDIAVYAAHTNLDVAPQGVNKLLADKLGLTSLTPLKRAGGDRLYKLAVFVPHSHLEQVRQALGNAGAGHVGNYSHCTFAGSGIGSFLPLQGAQPFMGEVGELELAEEYRVETIVPEADLAGVIRAMLKAHPYEEAAYDVIPLHNQGAARSLGVIGRLSDSLTLGEFTALVQEQLDVKAVRFVGQPSQKIERVAVCGGSGGDMVYAANGRADVLVTGDVGYHQALDAASFGLAVIDAGHFATEWPMMIALTELMREKLKKEKIELLASRAQQDVWQWRSQQA